MTMDGEEKIVIQYDMKIEVKYSLRMSNPIKIKRKKQTIFYDIYQFHLQ